MPRYRIRHHDEEFPCPTCGAPVTVGDTAWLDGIEGYCSAYCAGADPAKQKPCEPSPSRNAAAGQ